MMSGVRYGKLKQEGLAPGLPASLCSRFVELSSAGQAQRSLVHRSFSEGGSAQAAKKMNFHAWRLGVLARKMPVDIVRSRANFFFPMQAWKKRGIAAIVALGCLTMNGWATNTYHTNRVFQAITFTIPGVPTAFEVYNMAGQLTTVVGPTNVITTNCFATEYQSVALGHGLSNEAWAAAVAGYPSNSLVHTNYFYDNAGWVKGVHQTESGKWGGYIWLLQNTVNFKTSASNIWVSANGVTNAISKVLVGTIGDYAPLTDEEDTGPSLAGLTNWPTPGDPSNDVKYKADFTAYYDIGLPALWIQPLLTNVCINSGNVTFWVITNSYVTNGVTWSIAPEGLTNGAVLTGYATSAVVAVGGVATSYVVKATANDNTNIYGEAVLNVVELQSIELVSGATNKNVIPPHTWATAKNTNATPQYVVVRAGLNPVIAESALSDGFITWTGGESVANHPLQRRVSKQTAAHTQVIATCGGTSATGDVWVVWADLEIRMTGSTTNTPNSARFGSYRLDGTEELGAKLYNFRITGDTNIISKGAAGKVIPIGQLEPAGIYAITTNKWTIKREMIRHDYKDGAVWTNRWLDSWTDDPSDPLYTKFNPDNRDKIYDLDAPDIAKFQGGVQGNVTNSCERYDHFRQWVTWNDIKCSDYSPWYWFARWKDNTNLDLQVELMEVGVGNPDFPTPAPHYLSP